jgi:hypothetical protein
MFEWFKGLGVRVQFLIGLIIAGIIAYFKILNRKNKNLEAKLENSEFEKKEAVVDSKLQDIETERAKILDEARKQKGRELTPDEMVEFLRGL